MAEIRLPFCATAELEAPFMLIENYANPNGVKSVLFDKSKLAVMSKVDTITVPDVGPVEMCVYYVTGTIPFVCCAFPVVQSAAGYDIQENGATFNDQPGNTAPACVATDTDTPLGWVSASGCVNVTQLIGGGCTLDSIPIIESVSVDDLAVANNLTSKMVPLCADTPEPCGEQQKRIVKWRGCFVITTSSE